MDINKSFIGITLMQCLIFETEDKHVYLDSVITTYIRKCEISGCYSRVMEMWYDDNELTALLEYSDENQVANFVCLIEDEINQNIEYLEFGEPELEILCDQSCRGDFD